MKTIDTLISDIYSTIGGKGNWTKELKEFMSKGLEELVDTRLSTPPENRKELSPSSLGEPCKRKLWYTFNTNFTRETSPLMIGTFFYGDLIELFIISLIKASGHTVEGYQDKLVIGDMKGTSDCIVDGMLLDVKSASGYGFEKFRKNSLKEDDPYGYISQLSSYLYAYKDDQRVHNKTTAGFLAINKERFELKLDFYDLTEEIANKEKEIADARAILSQKKPPEKPEWEFTRKIETDDGPAKEVYKSTDEEDGENRKLGKPCKWCHFKFKCWDNLRAFKYSNEVKYLTEVNKLPRVEELILHKGKVK